MSNQGWECPKCGYVYSPITPSCFNCNRPDHSKVSTYTNILIPAETTRVCICSQGTKNTAGICTKCGGK